MVAMTVDAPARPPVDLDQKPAKDWIVIGLAAVLVVLCGMAISAVTPHHLESITVENPTQNDLSLFARAPDETGVTAIGNVDRDDSAELEAVLDQGETWVIELEYAGVQVGEETVSRDELEAGWTIPPEVADQIAEAGFTPSPP